jgi:ribulose-5-phosphate 4-epimerase/fuculose-1-phosphate aldolase
MIVGPSVDAAVSNTIYLERTAIMQVIATIMGGASGLSDEYVAKFGPDWAKRASHAYEYFRSLVPSLNQPG